MGLKGHLNGPHTVLGQQGEKQTAPRMLPLLQLAGIKATAAMSNNKAVGV